MAGVFTKQWEFQLSIYLFNRNNKSKVKWWSLLTKINTREREREKKERERLDIDDL